MIELKNMNKLELQKRAEEIRELLIDTVSKNGGHLAPNLGVVELTIAIHRVFDSPKDKIIFDVGHQSYVHKILTGREKKFHTLRQRGGIAPFCDPEESEHDPFISGHAGTGLSAGAGLAKSYPDSKIIIVIGDASICNGHSLEALNNMTKEDGKNIIVVLNNNEMSIGRNVGTIANSISKLMTSNIYKVIKKDIRGIIKLINKGKFGEKITTTLERAEISIKQFFSPLSISEIFGFNFYGTIDGHNIQELEECLEKAKNDDGPTFIHVKTQKGKGYLLAEEDSEKFHGIAPFNPETGATIKGKESYSQVFGKKITEMGEKDENIFCVSAAMVKGVGLEQFFYKFPDRVKDVGICEGHGITYSTALAVSGKKPYFALYSTFLQRGISQLIHDISYQKSSVKLIIDRAGIVGEDGKTHNGIYDASIFLTIKNFMVISPTTKTELEEILEITKDVQDKSIVIRYPREISFNYILPKKFQMGKWQEVKTGADNLFIATGSMFQEIMEIREQLLEEGVDGTIVSAASMNPLDEEYISQEMWKYKKIIVLEENYIVNAFGSSIVNYLNKNNILKKIDIIGIEDPKIPHGSRDVIMKELGLRGESLIKRIKNCINGEVR